MVPGENCARNSPGTTRIMHMNRIFMADRLRAIADRPYILPSLQLLTKKNGSSEPFFFIIKGGALCP